MRLRLHHTSKDIGKAVAAAQRGECELFWVVYHGNHRMTVRAFAAGFQPTPCTCPVCCKTVTDPDGLRYTFASKMWPKLSSEDQAWVERAVRDTKRVREAIRRARAEANARSQLR